MDQKILSKATAWASGFIFPGSQARPKLWWSLAHRLKAIIHQSTCVFGTFALPHGVQVWNKIQYISDKKNAYLTPIITAVNWQAVHSCQAQRVFQPQSDPSMGAITVYSCHITYIYSRQCTALLVMRLLNLLQRLEFSHHFQFLTFWPQIL